MSARFWFGGVNWLEFTAGNFLGSGAYSVVLLMRMDAGSNYCFSTWQGTTQELLFIRDTNVLYGASDFTGVAESNTVWAIYALTKAAGASVYRIHYWVLDPAGLAGPAMTHANSGSATHADLPASTKIRIGGSNPASTAGGNCAIGAVGLWDRALSDAELNTMRNNKLQAWKDLTPQFLVQFKNWDGVTGYNIVSGSSTFMAETGSVDLDVESPYFDYTIGGGSVAEIPTTPTVSDKEYAKLGGTWQRDQNIMYLLDASLLGDIRSMGYGAAIIKNWGAGVGTVNEAVWKKYGGVVGNPATVQDVGYVYWT